MNVETLCRLQKLHILTIVPSFAVCQLLMQSSIEYQRPEEELCIRHRGAQSRAGPSRSVSESTANLSPTCCSESSVTFQIATPGMMRLFDD